MADGAIQTFATALLIQRQSRKKEKRSGLGKHSLLVRIGNPEVTYRLSACSCEEFRPSSLAPMLAKNPQFSLVCGTQFATDFWQLIKTKADCRVGA